MVRSFFCKKRTNHRKRRNTNERSRAKYIAEKLIDILNKIGTDSPVYPVYRIKQTWLRNHGRTKKECDNEI